MKSRVPLFVLAVAVLAAGCEDTQSTAPRPQPSDPSKMIFDGAHHGGNPDFFFLPLLGPDARHNPNFDRGKFNANLSPVVKICKLVTSTGATLRTVPDLNSACGPFFPTISDVRVFPTLEFYLAFWKTWGLHLDPDAYYRVQVFVGSTRLGYVDVTVVTSLREAKNAITGEVVPLGPDWTLPILFRIEAGALTGGTSSACKPPNPDCLEVSVKSTGGTFFTNTHWAGVLLEDGWASPAALAAGGGSILLTIERVRAKDGNCHGGSEGEPAALGHLYFELAGCYHYKTDPDLDLYGGFQTDGNKVGQCTTELPATNPDADYLLFKSDPGQPITALKDVPPPLGLNCANFAFYEGLPSNPVLRFASIKLHSVAQVISLFVVNVAYAWDGGLGGGLHIFDSFSNISRGVGLRMEKVASTDNQSAPVGGYVDVKVRVTDAHPVGGSVPKAGVPVTFAVATGGGYLSFGEGEPPVVTDVNGEAVVRWYLGPAAGTNTLTAEAKTIEPTGPLTFTATGTVLTPPGPIFRATFTNDVANLPPGPAEIGTLDASPITDGTALVQSNVGGIEGNSLEVSTPGEIPGSPRVSARVAGTAPSSGVYVVRWRSSATGGLPTMNFVVRSSTALVLAAVNYGGGTHTFNAGSPDQVTFGEYVANVPQLFELTIDLTAKTVSLSVDGVAVSSVQNKPFFQTGAAELASVSMEFGGLQAYSMAWDDIEVFAP